MTVTTDPALLRREAARMALLGLHAYADHMYREAVSNVPAAVRGSQSTTDTNLAETEKAASRVFQTKGHDGTTLTG